MNNAIESAFTQDIVLPSQGLLNPEIPEGKITQRCMMVADQKVLSSTNKGAGEALRALLQHTVTSPEGFDIHNLCTADTMYLLFKLRSLSYGDNYTFRTRCPECGRKIDIEVNLAELPVESLEDGFSDKLVIELPHRGDTVYTKILTNFDLEEVDNEIKRRKRKNPDDESAYTLRIVRSIEKIKIKKDKSELTHPIDIERYVNSLTDLDASAIIAARDSVSFGVAPFIEHQCPECKEYIDVSMNFSGDFFRPSFNK